MLRRLAIINVLAMVFVFAGTAAMAEQALLRWNEEYIGWRQDGVFITCSGERLPLADAAVTGTTRKCPPLVASAGPSAATVIAPGSDVSADPGLPGAVGTAAFIRAVEPNVGEIVTLSVDAAALIALMLVIFL